MVKEVQVAAYVGGGLKILAGEERSREAVLALPLNRLLVKLVHVPPESDSIAVSAEILKKINPFPDDELTVSCETVSESPSGKLVIAAALPESSVDDIAERLDAEKLNVTRIDALVLGELRSVWDQLAIGSDTRRRIVIFRSPDVHSVIVLDGDRPSAVRALTDLTDLRRDLMLCLVEAESFAGANDLAETVVVRPVDMTEPLEGLLDLAPIREITVNDEEAALRGIAERSADAGAIDALPASWREVLNETRFKHKLIRNVAIAGGVWLMIMGVFFAVPIGYGYMTDYQKGLSKQHAKQYNAVKEMKAKVDLVRKYSDHARGALEIMKAVSDRLPDGIELSKWDYKREDGVRVSGEADEATQVYDFKNTMADLKDGDDGDGLPVFAGVTLVGPTASRNKQRFDIDLSYHGKEEE